MQEAFERLTAAPGVADCLGEFRFAGDAAQFLFPERPELGDDGGRLLLACGTADVGVLAADFFLDRPQLGHPLDGFARHMRDAGHVQFIEFAPQMRPTRRQRQRTPGALRFREPVIGTPSVDLKQSCVAGEMALHAVAAAAVLEEVGDHGRRRAAKGSIVPCEGP